MSEVKDELVIHGAHPYAKGGVLVRARVCRLPGALMVRPSPAERLLGESFGVLRFQRMIETMGETSNLVEILDAQGRCLLVFLFAIARATRLKWAQWFNRDHCDASIVLSAETVLADFFAIPRQNRGSMSHYLAMGLRYLSAQGFLRIVTECQELRRLVFLTRKGVTMLNPPTLDPSSCLRALIRQGRSVAGNSVADQIGARIHEGGGSWGVFLEKPVYLVFEMDSWIRNLRSL